jgi:hypothetical protein
MLQELVVARMVLVCALESIVAEVVLFAANEMDGVVCRLGAFFDPKFELMQCPSCEELVLDRMVMALALLYRQVLLCTVVHNRHIVVELHLSSC